MTESQMQLAVRARQLCREGSSADEALDVVCGMLNPMLRRRVRMLLEELLAYEGEQLSLFERTLKEMLPKYRPDPDGPEYLLMP